MSQRRGESSLSTESFLADVSRHELEVLRDDGLYRHLRFWNRTSCGQRSSDMMFDVLTSPGLLVYSGDMGTFAFRRIDDMLVFFRRGAANGMENIDKRYWAEKCVSEGRHGDGVHEFDPQAFKREISNQRRRMLVEHGRSLRPDQRQDLWDSLGDVIDAANDGEGAAIAAAQDWGHDNPTSNGRRLCISTDDFPDCKRFTQRFAWCCYALVWAVNRYDVHKADLNANLSRASAKPEGPDELDQDHEPVATHERP
jgi:hypothetical protein